LITTLQDDSKGTELNPEIHELSLEEIDQVEGGSVESARAVETSDEFPQIDNDPPG